MSTKMEIPHTYNVYGYFSSNKNLEDLLKVFQFQWPYVNSNLEKSIIDGTQTIRIQSEYFEFESKKFNNEGLYKFDGSVAGNSLEVCERVKEIYLILMRNHYFPKFEIYNEQFEFVFEYKYE